MRFTYVRVENQRINLYAMARITAASQLPLQKFWMLRKKINKPQKPFVRFLMVTGGITSVTLGIIGIVLPILPTTPFFLLSAYLFVRSSERLYRWLLTHPIFGNYIRNYIHHKSISRGVKTFTLLLLWGTILLSVYIMYEMPIVQTALLIVAMGVSVHVLRLRTMPSKDKDGLKS